MKNPAVTVILILVIVGSLSWLTWFYASQPEPGEPIAHMMPVACDACGAAYGAMVGKQPAKCIKCGKKAAWRAFKCLNADCKTIFPYKGAGKSIEDQPPAQCPKCGGSRCTPEISPDEIEMP